MAEDHNPPVTNPSDVRQPVLPADIVTMADPQLVADLTAQIVAGDNTSPGSARSIEVTDGAESEDQTVAGVGVAATGGVVEDPLDSAISDRTKQLAEVELSPDTQNFIVDIDEDTANSPKVLESQLLRTGQDGFVRNEAGKTIDRLGLETTGRGDRALVERRRVSGEQAQVVLAAYQERLETKQAVREATSQLQSIENTRSFVKDVIEGVNNSKVLESQLLRTGQDGFVRNEAGKVVDKLGFEVSGRGDRALVERRRVSGEQAALILKTFDDVSAIKAALPPEIRQLIIKPDSQTVGAAKAAVEANRQKTQVMSELQACDQQLEALTRLEGIVRRADLIRGLSSELTTGSPESALALLESTPIQTAEDAQFAQEQRRFISARIVADAGIVVLDKEGTPAKALDLIDMRLRTIPGLEESAAPIIRLALRRQLLNDYFQVFEGATERLDYQRRFQELCDLPLKADRAGFAYKTESDALIADGMAVLVQARAAEIRKVFGDKAAGASEVIGSIMELPAASEEDLQLQEELLDAFALYIAVRRKERPEDFSEIFSEQTRLVRDQINPKFPESLDLGRNLQTATYLAGNFKDTLAILFQAARGDQRTKAVEKYIKSNQGIRGRESTVLDLDRLEAQRPLTELEAEYLESVEALSIFNPHMVALARENPAVTRVFLESYFNELSQQTTESLREGDYVPLLFIGLGPNGVAGLGELARIDPELLSQTLVVDGGELPGGPFAIPGGEAWFLNSANERGAEEPTLPDSPLTIEQKTGVPEEKTVRAYGSPLPWYPGERSSRSAVREGSINTTVDYLITPDDVSDTRYATNDELALVLQLQASLLVKRATLRTEVLEVSPNPDASAPGDKLVRLLIRGEGDQAPREVTVCTNAVIAASGLGEPYYGFEMENSDARFVMRRTTEQPREEMPLLSDTLTAFEALSSAESAVESIGDTVVIYGGGNSADTLVEYLSGIFPESNPIVRSIKKIVVITTDDLSKRPRYASINDVRRRNGLPNLVEIIPARVADVRMEPDGKSVVFLNENGQEIYDERGYILVGNHAIAATGFRPQLDKVFAAYLPAEGSFKGGNGLESVTLPTNKEISVADRLEADPSILLIGTASRPDFNGNRAKLSQLPPNAEQALIRNGAENAVAIGFRRPDDQAAIRLFSQEVLSDLTLQAREETSTDDSVIPIEGVLTPSPAGLTFELSPEMSSVPIRRDLQADSSILTPLFLQGLGRIKATETARAGSSYDFVFSLSQPDEKGEVTLSYEGNAQPGGDERLGISPELLSKVGKAMQNPILQAYATRATPARRLSQGFRVVVSLRNGRLDLKNSYMEPR